MSSTAKYGCARSAATIAGVTSAAPAMTPRAPDAISSRLTSRDGRWTACTLEARGLDELPGVLARRVLEDGARVRVPLRLMPIASRLRVGDRGRQRRRLTA